MDSIILALKHVRIGFITVDESFCIGTCPGKTERKEGAAELLNMLLREFMAICEFLERSHARVYKGGLLVRREALEELMDKNRYETSANKLKYWKTLGWIDTEKNRLTVRVYDSADKKYHPYVKIDRERYECIRELSREAL